MDSSKKPERENPKNGANPISLLFFLWIAPLLLKGTNRGLNTDDLIKCLEEDKSDTLGDDLEREWKREFEIAEKGQRKPRLRNAMFRLFAPKFIIDGINCFTFIAIRSILPLVLAQLLIQFQKPIIDNSSIVNITSRDTIMDQVAREALIYANSDNQTNGDLIDQRLSENGVNEILL